MDIRVIRPHNTIHGIFENQQELKGFVLIAVSIFRLQNGFDLRVIQ